MTFPRLGYWSRSHRFSFSTWRWQPQLFQASPRSDGRRSFFFQAEDGIRDSSVTGVQTCALPICVGDGYELLHRRTEALRWIGKSLALGFSREAVKRNPELSGLTADPRFRILIEKLR